MKIKNDAVKILVEVTDDDIKNGIFIMPKDVWVVDNTAFKKCQSLKSIIIPNGDKIICSFAFSHCFSLENIIIPDSVTSICGGAFSGCISLKSIIIPNSVTSIGYYAFRQCISLENIIIPDSVTSIERGAFERCISLKSITIPNSVTDIGDNIFAGCTSLENIIISTSLKKINFWFKEIGYYSNNVTISIYKYNVSLKEIYNKISEIRHNELFDRIKEELSKNKIKNARYYEYSQHKKIIDEIVEKIETEENYDYKIDLELYLKSYIEKNKNQIITYKPMDVVLSELQNYNINNIENIESYAMYISGVYYNIISYYSKNTNKLKVKKNLDKLSKQSIIEKLFSRDEEDKLYLNEDILKRLSNFILLEEDKIGEESKNLLILKQIVEIYLEILTNEKEYLENVILSEDENTSIIATNKLDNIEKIILVISGYKKTINTHILINNRYITKLKEIMSVQIPSLLLSISHNYIKNSIENIEILNSLSTVIQELIDRSIEKNENGNQKKIALSLGKVI